MKKLLAILLICLIPTFAGAVDWHKADSIVFAWDAPTTYEDGTAIPDGLVISYDVYTKNVDGSNITMMLTTNDLQSTVVLLKGDKKFVGVAAHYVDPDGIAVGPSVVAWSDNPVDCLNEATFGVHNLKSLGKSKNLRK